MTTRFWVGVATIGVLGACDGPRYSGPTAPATATHEGPAAASMTVFATGLENPRGLEFGPDGNLYVAEGGRGGGHSTAAVCEQVPPPIGPLKGDRTGRISRLDPSGARTTVVIGLPSSAGADGQINGVADVAFVGNALYALLVSGCAHGEIEIPASVIRVEPDGAWSVVGDLGAYKRASPGTNPERDDPDGVWYSMVAAGNVLYVVEANSEQVVRVTQDGSVSQVLDVFAALGESIVPTASAYRGDLFVANLSEFPLVNGAARLLRITESGSVSLETTGLTAVLGLAFDAQGRLYALETLRCPTSAPCFPSPATIGTGRVVRIGFHGAFEVVATGLTFPTGMTFGPDGALYVSNFGFGAPPGAGQIVRIELAS